MKPKKFNRLPQLLIYAALIIVILVAVQMLGTPVRDRVNSVSYSELLDMVEKDELAYVMTTGNNLVAATRDSGISASEFPQRYNVASLLPSTSQFYSDVNAIYAEKLGKDADLIKVSDYSFIVTVTPPATTPWWVEWIPLLVTMLLFGVLWYFMMRQQGGGGKGVMNFGKSRARLSDPSKNKVTFANVAGAQEETEELREIVDFLKDPKKFQDLGARVPKGVLLVGPPGTGKTLLARAVAGEAGVPFFTISGSDFVEMFVGVGASRVRDLFDEAKKRAPAIVFIDEIDAVGRQRGAGLGGGHDEREQTLNQLLVEMDGFTANQGIIVMAATNRADILDPALLRPGRFDRQITVSYPDVKGREDILKIHAKGKPLAADVDLSVIARRTPYFTGADLENVLNEAAILTARANGREIAMATIEEAITRVSAGPEKKSHKVTEKDKYLVAYHEAGHAVVMHYIPECDRVHEVSIIPRGKGAGGYTMWLPDEETSYISSNRLKASIAGSLGGHCAEKLVLGDVSTGSSSDLKKATQTARAMVTEYGMSGKLGPMFLGEEHEVFLGRDFSQTGSNVSDEVSRAIDEEVHGLLEAGYDRAMTILTEHRDKLDAVARALQEKEKLDQAEFEAIMNDAAVEAADKPAETGAESEAQTDEQ
ncbi:MAG: ATP-dependent zinc metalloprotease FtsH [Eubacteriales bacterium]|nr:ATP-dependent zinc metalloprotease FtsH [Eubacteriales bacterium]